MTKRPFYKVVAKYKDYPEFLGIDLHDVNQPGAVDDTLLHLVSRLGEIEDIRILIEAGADVNISGDLGNTPLHGAAMRGQLESVTVLLELGANPFLENEFGQTPISVAELAGNKDIVNVLTRHTCQK